jgi:transposase
MDVHLSTVTASFVLDDATSPAKRISFPNNPSGANKLALRVRDICAQRGITDAQIGMETTGNLWVGLADVLRSHPVFDGLHIDVHSLNARQAAQIKKLFPEMSKNDPVDAAMIAEYLRFRRLPTPHLVDEHYLALQQLTRHRFHLVQSLAGEKNRFISHLFLKFSGFRQDKPLSDTFGAASSALLTEFLSVDEIAQMSIDEMIDLLKDKGRDRFIDPEKTATRIKAAAAKSYRLNSSLVDPVNTILAMTLENIRFFERQIKTIDKAIERQLRAFSYEATILASIPGIGPVFSAGIIAEIAGVERFDNDGALARFAAIVWKHHKSGEFTGDDTPMMHSGNQYLRYYFVEAANSLRLHNDEFAAYYQTKYREATKHQHKRACVLTARKFVRLAFNLLHKGMLYRTPQQRKEYQAANPLPEGTTPGELARHAARRRQAKRPVRIHIDH